MKLPNRVGLKQVPTCTVMLSHVVKGSEIGCSWFPSHNLLTSSNTTPNAENLQSALELILPFWATTICKVKSWLAARPDACEREASAKVPWPPNCPLLFMKTILKLSWLIETRRDYPWWLSDEFQDLLIVGLANMSFLQWNVIWAENFRVSFQNWSVTVCCINVRLRTREKLLSNWVSYRSLHATCMPWMRGLWAT